MDCTSNPITNLYELIRNLSIVWHKKRQEFLCQLVEGVIESRSVHFSEIADKIAGNIEPSSKERRIQDFFQKVNIDFLSLGKLMLSFVHHEKVKVSIDRTEWDYGNTQINILCTVVSIGKMAVPIYFEMLDNNSGNSNWSDRITLFQKVVQIIGMERISLLLMDREFIGHNWLKWLKEKDIAFCVRVPKQHMILFADGERHTAKSLLEGRKTFLANHVVVDQVVVNVSLSYSPEGELLYLIGTVPCGQLKACYKKRWTIEVFFQALKQRGFNLEDSCLRDIDKYRKLFAVVSLAYTICWATGIQDARKNPVRVKKHGYPQYSVFRRGLNLMRKFYKNKIVEPLLIAIQRAADNLEIKLKTIG